MRSWLNFPVAGQNCAATLDDAAGHHGLLLISGGNEVRAGAHRSQSWLAAEVAARGHPVWRYDRRGVGDSEGENGGFLTSAADITAAAAAFRAACPRLQRITAFGNCDAAAALMLFHAAAGIDGLLLANPWVIEDAAEGDGEPALPPAAAIRARYWAKLRRPDEWLRLLRGGVDLGKLWRGISAARGGSAAPQNLDSLSARMAAAMQSSDIPATLLLARGDRTAQIFIEQWQSPFWQPLHARIPTHYVASASHGFADDAARDWLLDQILTALSAD
ncbi:MAG: hydrolase 1, exosortase A system-associated [Sphingomonadaceae bacterium]|nr:hydrolase 1, exosortase A system-associated [Sphingomonadaceae bacterium]